MLLGLGAWHGLVLADLLVLPAVAVGACLALEDVRERRGRAGEPAARHAPVGDVSRTGPAGPG